MWLTILTITIFCFYIIYIFTRGKYVFLHSYFLIPLYPVIFFIDHNAHYILKELESDSVHFLYKLIPLYLNIILLAFNYRPKLSARLNLNTAIVNIFLIYTFLLSVIVSVDSNNYLSVFYVSYSIPLFIIYFNSSNLVDEVERLVIENSIDRQFLQMYFFAFILIYAAGLYYSISSEITSSLLGSRGVGSVFASTSALIYCILYAPLLSKITSKKYPYIIIIILGLTSLSKTAFLTIPSYGIFILRDFFKANNKKVILYFIIVLTIIATFPMWSHTSLVEQWTSKFTLGDQKTLVKKAYLNRVALHEAAFKIINDQPLGVGMGSFEKYNKLGYRDAHNFLINVIMESGIICGSLFIIVFFVSFIKNIIEVFKGTYEYSHFSFISIFFIYTTASGVFATTGSSEFTTIYYTPFYGVAIFQLLNISNKKGYYSK